MPPRSKQLFTALFLNLGIITALAGLSSCQREVSRELEMGPLAVSIARNYANMFSVQQVINQ